MTHTVNASRRAKLLALLLATSCLTWPVLVDAQVTPADNKTRVNTAPNGVPVVDIANPNAGGLSHNRYNDYNVDTRGLVLNNGDSKQLTRQSQLAGQITANMNLSKEATVILNEVVQPNRSLLKGYTEVVGGAADVIVANPFGITCSGCGFINTPNVTLTTGAPQLNGSGNLTGFNVQQGDILINGTGLNASNQDYLALVARKIKFDGQVNAKAVDAVAGSNIWDTNARTASAQSPTGTTPDYAIDSTALGGMYFDRIHLIATEAGVGVRMLGDVAAGAGDFTLNSAGTIQLANKISAQNDLLINTSATGAGAITASNVSLTSGRDLMLTATSGGVDLTGGTIKAGRDLAFTAGTLADITSTASGADNNKRFAAGTLTLAATSATIDGTSYGSTGAWTGNFGSFAAQNGAKLYSDSTLSASTSAGALALNNAQVKSTGALALTSTGGLISTATGGVVQSTAGATLTSDTGVTNNGTVDAAGLTVRSNGTITNNGTMHSSAAVDIGDTSNGLTENLTNNGTLLAEGDLTAAVHDITNAGTLQGNQTSALTLSGQMTNSGKTILANTASYSGSIIATSISNTATGVIQSAGALNTRVATSLTNAAGAKILSDGNLTLRGASSSAYTINNSGAIQAGGALDIKGYNAGAAVNINGTGSSAKFIGNTIDFNAQTVNLSSGASITSANNLLINTSTLAVTGSGSSIVASTATHSGTANITFGSTDFFNDGAVYSNGDLTLSGRNIFNNSTGMLGSYHNASLTASGSSFTNTGTLYAGNNLTLSANSIGATFSNLSGGLVNAANDITLNAVNFVNENDFNATHDLTLNVSNNFINQIPGGDQREWSNVISDGNTDSGWSSDPVWLVWGQSADRYYSHTYHVSQSYAGGAPSSADKPRLLSNHNLTISGFSTAINLGGIISAPTVLISSTQAGAHFTNDDYSLSRTDYSHTWYDHVSCCADGIHLDYSYNQGDNTTHSDSTISTFGAGIYASTLTATGFGLTNQSTLVSASSTAASKSGASSVGTVSGTTFGGITITLPTSPNGLFIISHDPNSQYLIETNPLYGPGSWLSSLYMIQQLGLNPDTVQKRLGDGNYEASLIRDQLTAQTGKTVLVAGETETQQMQRLMDNGVDQAKSLGLKLGVAPTAEQIAGLGHDMVWMVETVVSGQKVLAPVVYLSSATKASITTGAVIAANNMNMNLTTLANNGGTISGDKTLNITTKGDMTNTSGTIKGGDVSLTSTEGSIINKTYSKTTGNDEYAHTDIGKTAGIQATGNLNVDAKKDFSNAGAQVSAGGDASLKAGQNITFDTIADKEANTTHSHSGNAFSGSTSSTTEGTVKQIGSGLTVGGNLKTDSGNDTTLRGSNVTVGGNADMHADGNFNVLDAQDESYSKTSTTQSGMGVGGGVYGMQSVDDRHDKKTSVGSNIKIGGNGSISSDKTLTVQGSDISTGGDMALKAQDVKILEGRNEETSSHSVTTTTFLKNEGGSSSSDSNSGSSASSGTDSGKASADAEAHAGASNESSGGVTLSSTETTTTNHYTNTGKASNIKSGGNMTIESKNDTTIRGSNVEAGGDVDLKGKNVNILASENIDTTTTKTSKTSIGLYGDSSNKADASADAGAHADRGGATADSSGYNAGDANADAGAHASASASSNNTVDFMRTTTSTDSSTDVTHNGASIKSGGKTNINADNQLNVVGSGIDAGGDVNLNAKDMSFTAATDSHSKTHDSSTTSVGLYADGEANASANVDASGQAKTLNGSASAGVSADANAGIGLQGKNVTESSTDNSTHAVTSSIKSGGNMTRNATNKITDEGTQIEAGGDFTQTAKEWDSKAAHDTHSSTSNSETNTARVGLYAEGSAGASAGADARSGTSTDSGADASAGVKASYNRTTSGESSSESNAVTGSIKSGGNMKTTTTGKTSLEGTNLESGGNMELNAGSLDYKAAQDTKTSSKNSSNIDAEVKVGVDATKAVTGSVSGGYDADRSTDSSTHAVVGGMKSGGNMKVNTTGDAHFEGTNLDAGGDAAVKSGGNLTFDAAHDTSSHTGGSENASASISASKSKGSSGKGSTGMGVEASGGFSRESSSSSDAVTGSIKSGGKMDLSAGKNATFEGTALESGGDMNVGAKGDVKFNAAKSTSTSESYGAQVDLKGSKGGKTDEGKNKGSSMGIDASGNYSKSDSTTSTAGSLKSGGGINVKSGNDVVLEGTNIDSKGKTTLDAAHDVNFKAKEDKSSSIGFDASLSGEKSKAAKVNGDAKENGSKAGGSFNLEGGTSSTKTGGTINAGSIDVKAGHDATLEGSNLNSKGDTSLKAGHDVNLNAATSSNLQGNLSAGGTSEGVGSGGGNIGGGVQKSGVKINGGGDLKIESGNNTTMEGTKADVGGKADVKAGGKIDKKSTVSGSGQIGTTSGGATLDIENTDIKAGQGVTEGH